MRSSSLKGLDVSAPRQSSFTQSPVQWLIPPLAFPPSFIVSADPTLPLMFPSHHGLLHLHAPFHLSSLAPPSQKLSTLVGGRGGQNNLAFKLKRKAFVVETLHLDVEGGVGERRTTAPVALGGEEHSHAGHAHDGHDHAEPTETVEGGRVRIEVVESESSKPAVEDKSAVAAAKVPRKSALKKSVGFAVVDPTKPELYEF